MARRYSPPPRNAFVDTDAYLDDLGGRRRGRSVVLGTLDSSPNHYDSPPHVDGDEAISSPQVEDDDDNSNRSTMRGRSRSIVDTPGSGLDSTLSPTSLVAKAASLTKLYLAGGSPVTDTDFPAPTDSTAAKVSSPTGALNEKTMEVLSEGLMLTRMESNEYFDTPQPSEEEAEEQRLAEEEAKRLREEKKQQQEEIREDEQRWKSSRNKKRPISEKLQGSTGGWSLQPLDRRGSEIDLRGSLPGPLYNQSPITTARDSISPRKRFKVKLLMLGDSGVGKTSLMQRWCKDTFSESMLATAGVDFVSRGLLLDGKETVVQLWDTAGQERFRRITATYYKNANGIILVYDVSSRKSFKNISHWIDSIRLHGPADLAIMLVGNKIDLKPAVSTSEGERFAARHSIRFFETSAKTAANVDDSIAALVRDALVCTALKGQGGQKAILKQETATGKASSSDCTIT